MLGRNHLMADSLFFLGSAKKWTESSINSSCDNQILSFGRFSGEKKWGWLLLWVEPPSPKQKNTQIDAGQLVFNWDEL